MRVKITLENYHGKEAHEKYIAEYTRGTKLRVVGSYSPVVPRSSLTSWMHALVSDVTVYLLSDEEENYGGQIMGTIKVDFIKAEYHFWRTATYSRIQFEENYDVSMLPQKGSLIVIGDKTYRVEDLVYFPFGDKDGQIGVRVYLS